MKIRGSVIQRFLSPIMVLLSGCQGETPQSALHPAGPASAWIAWLWWILFAVCTVVFIVVILLLFIGISRRYQGERAAPPLGGTKFIVVGGIILPAIILVALLVLTLKTTLALTTGSASASAESTLTVRVIGHQWWWEVRYPEQGIVTANEIYIPAGVPVRFELRAADVIHSFWVPRLGGKRDLLPSHDNVLRLQADEPGTYRGQCAEYCGVQHAHMAIMVVALPPEEFDAWVEDRQAPHPEPATAVLQQGQAVFLSEGCGACHTIRGTEASGEVGPDLTYMGSRLTIGAGTLHNTYGNLAGWVADPQPLKPGNKMPATYLEPADLHALVSYLESLK